MREVETGRDVAIKMFDSHPDDLASAARAARNEFEVAHALHLHHGVLPEEIAIDGAHNKAYLVFALMEGTTLANHPAISEPIARQVLFDIARALAELAAQGVSHNDIHGNNIMVCDGRGYLIDFGIASKTDCDLLWVGDMQSLRSTMVQLWPSPQSVETRDFFAWFKRRLTAGNAALIARDVAQHPFISICQ